MKRSINTLLVAAAALVSAHAGAQITFYEREGFAGRWFTTDQPVGNFERHGFNDRASSVVVEGGRWEVCDDARFQGRCAVLRPGGYASLAALGLGDRVSSVRPANRQARYEREQYGRYPVIDYDYRRRGGEALYQARVTSVRAVVGPPEQRCWIEREEVTRNSGNVNVPGAIAGAVIGGILGHQIGGGRGQDIATAGGAVGGAALGAQIGHGGSQTFSRDVERCAYAPTSGTPDYWDVTYVFRGREHHLQTSAPPGSTITVNGNGEPRV